MKYNKDCFIKDAINVHGDKYNYDNSIYVNKTTKLNIKCNACGKVFMQTPKSHLKGQGCPICGKKKATMCHKYDYNAFLKKAHNMYGDKFSFPKIDAEYENNKKKITIKCNDCGYEFKKRPNDFLNNKVFRGCKRCRENNRIEDDLISYDELAALAKGNDIEFFNGKLRKSKDKVYAICKTHGKYDTLISSVIKNKYKCKKCVGTELCKSRATDKNTFSVELNNKYGNIIEPFLDEYINKSTKMHFRCIECGHVFERTPNALISSNFKHPCPECSKRIQAKEKTKTQEEFIRDAINVWGEDKFDFSDTVYTKSNEKVNIKCNECGRTFSIEANSFLSGEHGCPYHNCNSSKKEKEISEFINSLGIATNTNDRTALNGLEIDVYIPDYNIGIELDGIFWHNELYKDKTYHVNKTDKCNEAGIRLIHIFEDEWINKKEICKSMIRNILMRTPEKIYARYCVIKSVSSKEAIEFLDNNHIQGKCNGTIKYGLYYNDKLVSIMVFGKTRHFIGSSKHEYELLRFCNKINTNVVGGASKLFKFFIKEHSPKSIVSYADRRWSNGNLYDVLGFKLYNISKPNYFYVIDNKRKNRFNFRKSILTKKYKCPQEMSERDFCKSQKWWRIYDCGALCYEWVINI